MCPRGAPPAAFIDFNTAREYQPNMGFFVAADGAHRVSRLLPAAALVTYAPPGSFYQVIVGTDACVQRRHGFRILR
jgi:hypothetical protein